MSGAQEPPHHIATHTAQPNHSKLHGHLPSAARNPYHCEIVRIQKQIRLSLKLIDTIAIPQLRCGISEKATHSGSDKNYFKAFITARPKISSPASTFFGKCTRSARLLRSAKTWKSPRACAAFTIPNVYFCPNTGKSTASSQVICRNTPLFGPPLYACPVECRKREPKP